MSGKNNPTDNPTLRWVLIGLLGLLLLALPTIVRVVQQGRPGAGGAGAAAGPAYQAPQVSTPAIAVTPIPTPSPLALAAVTPAVRATPAMAVALRPGPVVVDLAHYSLIERSRFQRLEAALSQRGVDLQFWLPTVETNDLQRITDFPDQSAELSKRLVDASALVVVSPFFMYTPAEIAAVERFLTDGGRLLVISDPDIESDSSSDTNHLASAFGVVFNQDYLYDTVRNDENFTYFFQGEFLDQAAPLAGSTIAFYGARSISGDVTPQVRSAATTLSSVRNGLTGFDTVALGGTAANSSQGRVLALGDFDVLTDPYITRHDNRRMLELAADFLAGGTRATGITDFPGFLRQDVALAIENTQPVGALALSKAADLQRMLESSGRTLLLAPSGGQGTGGSAPAATDDHDLIYVASYQAADAQTTLLRDLGLTLVEEVVTPTAAEAVLEPSPTPTPVGQAVPGEAPGGPEGKTTPPGGTPEAPAMTPAPPEAPPPLSTPLPATPVLQLETTPTSVPPTGEPGGNDAQPAAPAAPTSAAAEPPAPAATPLPTPTPTPSPTPQVQLVIARGDGLRLLADETLLYVRSGEPGQPSLLAVLGNSEAAIGAGLTRLLNRDFAGCLSEPDLVLCPYTPGATSGGGAQVGSAQQGGGSGSATAAGSAGSAPAEPRPTLPPTPGPDGSPAGILIIDNNRQAEAGEPSEAAIYLTVLTTAGYTPDLWLTAEQGLPEGGDLAAYRWVIWSDAGYAASGVETESLRALGDFINSGGRLTISSRKPFFGMSARPPAAIKDVVIQDGVPDLVKGLPATPIVLTEETPLISPLEATDDPTADARVALARGPASGDTGSPVLLLLSDANSDDPKGALLLLFGMSMGWLPGDVSEQLIGNMAEVMLAE